MADSPSGWREPRLRLLRTAALALVLVLLAWLVIFEPGPNDLGAVGTLVGAMLVILGFEAGLRWPGGGK